MNIKSANFDATISCAENCNCIQEIARRSVEEE